MASLPRLGLLILALGILGMLRVIPEMISIRGANRLYWIVVVLDLMLAVMTVLAGAGVRRGDPRAPRMALLAAGVVVSTSIGWGVILAPEVASAFSGRPQHSNTLVLMPRLLFYLIAVLFWPYATRAIVQSAEPELRKSLGASLAASLVVGGGLMGALFWTLR